MNASMDEFMANELAKKMAKILGLISRIPKNGRNTFQNYKYATESDVLDSIRPILADHGIGLFYSCTEVLDLENGRTRVKVEFELVDGDSGESKTMICYGEARDVDKNGKVQDKGIYKAMTGACKYWLFKTFLISTGDDPEVDDTHSRPSSKPLMQQKSKPQSSGHPPELMARLKQAREAAGVPPQQVLEALHVSDIREAPAQAIESLITSYLSQETP